MVPLPANPLSQPTLSLIITISMVFLLPSAFHANSFFGPESRRTDYGLRTTWQSVHLVDCHVRAMFARRRVERGEEGVISDGRGSPVGNRGRYVDPSSTSRILPHALPRVGGWAFSYGRGTPVGNRGRGLDASGASRILPKALPFCFLVIALETRVD